MSKIAVFLAEGFEEIEALTVVDLCRRVNLDIVMISIKEELTVTGSHGICVQADNYFEEVVFEELDMIVLPGGMPGTVHLEAHNGLMEKVEEFYREGRYVAAICAAPSILGHRGILAGREACCYPGWEKHLKDAIYSKGKIAISEHVITSKGMGTAMDFGLAIIATLCGAESAKQLAAAVVYENVL